jgi:hypothetical protein
LNLQRRLARLAGAAATRELLREFVREHERRAVANPDVRELPQQQRRNAFRRQRLGDHLLQRFLQEPHQVAGKPPRNGFLGHVDPQFGRHRPIIPILGGRAVQQGKHQRPHQRYPAELALPLDTAGGSRPIIERSTEHRLHCRRHFRYDLHGEAPSSSLLGCNTRWYKDFPLFLTDQYP